MRKMYLINRKTVCLFSEFDQYGKQYTRVIEGTKMFKVSLTIIEMIEQTLNFHCSSLKGAIDGAKSILGEKYSIPIVIDALEGIILIPCGSLGKKDTIWIVNNQIDRLERLGKETIIYTYYGHRLMISMKVGQIEMKRGQASLLQTTQIHRSKKEMSLFYDYKNGMIIRKEKGKLNMIVENYNEK